jgi:hypothetical protein
MVNSGVPKEIGIVSQLETKSFLQADRRIEKWSRAKK